MSMSNVMSASLILHIATNGNDNASDAITQLAGDGPPATMEAELLNARDILSQIMPDFTLNSF